MSTEKDTDRQKAIAEAARMVELARDKIIPLFPSHYKVLLFARDTRPDGDKEKVFLTNEDPSDAALVLGSISKLMLAAYEVDAAEGEGQEQTFLHNNDGTIN